MSSDKTRIDFNAPTALVERADVIADALDTTRTRLLVDALRTELESLRKDPAARRALEESFYAGDIDQETLATVLGPEEAQRLVLLRASLDRSPPTPAELTVPDDAEFYGETPPEWQPETAADADG